MANLWDKIKEAVSGNSGNQEAQSAKAEPTPQSQPSRGLGGRPAVSQMSEQTASRISDRYTSSGKSTTSNPLAKAAISANRSNKETRYNNAKQRLNTAKNNLGYVTDTWQNDSAQAELKAAQKEYDEAKKEYEATLKNIESSREANKFLLEAMGKTQNDYPYNQGVHPTAFDMLAQADRVADTNDPRSPNYIAPMEISNAKREKPGNVAQDSLIDGPLNPETLLKNEAERKNNLIESNKDTWGETRQGANGVLTNDRREQLIKELNEDPYAGYAQDEVSAQQVNQRRQAILDELAQIDDAIGNGKMSYGSDKFFESAVNTITGATKQTASGITNFFGTAAMGLTDLSEKLGGDLDYEQSRQEAKQIQDVADALGQGASDDLEKAKKGLNKLGQAGVDIATNVIQMGYDSVFGGASLLSMFVRSAGGSMQEARFEGATTGEQLLYGGIGGGIEVVTEKVADGVAGIYGKGAADEITEEVIRRLTKSPFGRTALRFFSNAISEGGEEVMSDLLNPLARMTYNGKSLAASYKDLKPSEIVYDFIIGATIGALGGGTSVVNGQNAAANMELSNVDQVQSNLEANGMNHNDAVKAASIMADIANGKTISKRDAKFLNKLNQPINTTAPIDQMNPFIPSSQQNVSAQEKAQTIQNMPDGIEKAIAIEYQKTRTQSDIDVQSQIFEEFAEEILSAQPGQVLLDGDNKVVGKVLAVTDKGIAFEVDGEPNIVTTYNGRGLLDPNTKLVSYLRGNGVIANEADVEQYQNPTQYESNLGTRVAPEPQRAPSPMKPSSMEETDSGTGVSEESVQERLDKLQQMRQTAVEEGFGEDYIAQLDERIAEVTREAANGEDVVAEESAPTAEQEPEEAQPAPSPIKPSSREEIDSGTGTATNPIAETVATAESKQETAPETAQEESTAPSETLANALGKATAEETAPETNPIAEAATNAPVEAEQTTVENLSPAEKFYRDNPGKRTFEATLKDGQKVKITKGKDGYTVRAQKPNADGTGFITKYQTLGTAKTIAEANQLVKESKKAAPSTGNPIVDAATNVPTKAEEVSIVPAEKTSETKAEKRYDQPADDDIIRASSPEEQSTDTLLEIKERALNGNYAQEDKDFIIGLIDKELDLRRSSTKTKEELLNAAKSFSESERSIFTYDGTTYSIEDMKDELPFDEEDSLTWFIRDEYGNTIVTGKSSEQAVQNLIKTLDEKAEKEREAAAEKASFEESFDNFKKEIGYSGEPLSESDADDWKYGGDVYDFLVSNLSNAIDAEIEREIPEGSFRNWEDIIHNIEYGEDAGVGYYESGAFYEGVSYEEYMDSYSVPYSYEDFVYVLDAKVQEELLVNGNEDKAKTLYEILYHLEEFGNAIKNVPDKSEIGRNFTYKDFKTSLQAIDKFRPLARKVLDKFLPEGAINSENTHLVSTAKAYLYRCIELADSKGVEAISAPTEDSAGRTLTPGQSEYFKNSKLRDDEGRLRVFYHATTNLNHKFFDFNYADDGLTLWASDKKSTTRTYIGSDREASYFDEERGVVKTGKVFVPLKGEDLDKLTEYQNKFRDIQDSILDRFKIKYEIGEEFPNSEIRFAEFSSALDKFDIDLSENADADYTEHIIASIDRYYDIIKGYLDLTDEEQSVMDSIKELYKKALQESDIYGEYANVPVYINMENPYVIDGHYSNWNKIKPPEEVKERLRQLGVDLRNVDTFSLFFADDEESDAEVVKTRDLALYAFSAGYDGVVIQNITDHAGHFQGPDEDRFADILAMFDSNQMKDVKNENPTTDVDFRYKENVEEDVEDERQSEEYWNSIFAEKAKKTVDEPLPPEQIAQLSEKAVDERLRNWARAFKLNTNPINLANRVLDYLTSDKTRRDNSREISTGLSGEANPLPGYKSSGHRRYKLNSDDRRGSLENELYNRIISGEDVYNDYDDSGASFDETAKNYASLIEAEEEGSLYQHYPEGRLDLGKEFARKASIADSKTANYEANVDDLSEEQIADIFALIARKLEKENSGFSEDVTDDTDRDYGPFAWDENSDEGAYIEASLGRNVDKPVGFDRKKFRDYMAERNDANIVERLETLQKYFPEKEFRIVRDADYVRADSKYDADKHKQNKSHGEAYIEEVHPHKTSTYQQQRSGYGSKAENEWFENEGWQMALSEFGDEDQSGKKVYSDVTYMPAARLNRDTGEWEANPRLETKTEDGTEGNIDSVRKLILNGDEGTTMWVKRVAKGMYSHIVNSNVGEGIRQVIKNHDEKRKLLNKRLSAADKYISERENALNHDLIPVSERMAEAGKLSKFKKARDEIEEQLNKEYEFQSRLDATGQSRYTLGDFRQGKWGFSNSGKGSVITPEERSLIESYFNGFDDNELDGLGFKALSKSTSVELVKELIETIAEGEQNGYYQRARQGIANTISEFDRQKYSSGEEDLSGDSGRREFSSYSDLSKEDRAQLGRDQDLRGYPGTGEVVDDRSPVQSVSGTASTRGKGTRRPVVSIFAKAQAKTISNNINSRPEAKLTIRNKGGKPGATVNAKRISGQTYLQGEATGDLNPSNYTGTVKAAAETILKAANEFGIAVVQFKGQLYNQHTDANNSQYTTRVSAYNAINAGYIAVSELTEENAGIVMQDALHEITHKFTGNVFGEGSDDTVSFVESLAKKAKVTIDESKVAKVIRAYSDNGTLDSATADELISRIAEGDDCGGSFTNAELEKLQQALFDSDEWKNGAEGATAFSDLADYARTQLRNRPQAEKLSKAKPPTSVGVGTYTPQQQSTPYKTYQSYGEKETYRNSKERTDDLVRQAKTALENNDFDAAQELIRMAGTAPQNTDNGMYSDEMMDMYRGKYKYKEQFTINEKGLKVYSGPVPKGTPMGIYEYANPSKTFGDFNDYPQGRKWMTDQERAEVEQAANEWHESMDEPIIGRTVGPDNLNTLSYAVEHAKQVSGFTTMNTVWDDGKERWAYNQVKELKDRVGKQRSILNTPKLVPESFGTSRDIRSAGQRRANVIRLMKDAINGNGSMTGLFQYAQTMRDMKGTGQYFTPEVIYSLQNAAIAEAEAYAEGNPDSQRMQDFRYTAANALSQLQKQMENVDRIERTTRASLDALTTKYGKGNAKSFVGSAKQWLDSMQIDGGNFWRMMGGYNKAARNNAGYAMQRAHDKAIATQISTMAEAKNFFADVKDAKGFKDFANGKAMASDIPIIEYNEGEKKWEQTGSVKLSLLQAVKLKMTMDTLNAQAPDRLIRLKGFAVRDEKGNDTFINIPYKLDADERVQYLKDLYDSVSGDIEANEAASKYMKAAVDMFANFSPKLQAEAMKVNGYLKEMFAKGQYVPIQYANADGHKSRDWELVNDLRQGLNYERIMQNRTRSYGGYAVVNPISQTVDSYISQASNYIAFADLGNKLNIMSNKAGMNGGYGSVVREAFGDSYGRFYDNYVKSINMIRQQDPDGINKNLAKARQLMMQGALVGSLSVPIKQVSSYFSSMGVLDPRAVIAAYRGPLRRSAAGINNPFMLSRVQGSIDPDVSQALANGWVDKLRRSGKLGAVIANATNIMDSRTVANVYWASILDVEYNSGLTKAQLYNNGENAKGGLTAMGEFLVNSKFEEAVLNTQPIFTPQARNELSRTNSQLLRMFSTFRTQQTQNYNRLLTTIGEYNAAKKSDNKIVQAQAAKELRDTVTGQVMASASLAALTMVADFLLHRHKKYKDEDGEVDPMKIAERFALNAIESAGGTYLFGDAITKYLLDAVRGNTGEYASNKEFYGISMGAISSVESIFRAWTWLASDLAKGGKHAASNARYVVNYTATTLGIPVQNAYNLINMFYQWGKTITGNENEYEDIFKGWDALRTDYGSQLFNAIQAGNTAKADKAAAKMGDKIDDIIKASALERLRAGASDDEVAQVIADYTSNYRTEADKWVREAHMEIDTGYKFNNMKKEWKKGNITSEEAIQYQQKYGNKSKADAQKTVKGWEDGVDSLQKYGVEYGDMQTAYINGKLPRDTYIKAVMEYGDKTREEAEQTVYNADFKAKYGVSYDTEFKSLVRERKISDSEAVKWRMKCSGVKESTARNYVEKQHFLEKIGYEGDYTTYDDIGDTWATKEKMGLQSFYEQYGNQFKSPKAFGRLFQNIKDTGDSGNYPRYTYTYNGKEEVVGAEKSAVIAELNKAIANGDISYETAHAIWTKHYQWSDYKTGAWRNVHK